MNIKILGSGCKNCQILHQNTLKALEELGKTAEIEKVEDFSEIMGYGVMKTPALVVDGEVKSFGKVLKPEEIAKFL